MIFTFVMPISPEHLSDRYLSIFFTFCSIIYRFTGTLFRGGGGFSPGPLFPGEGVYAGEALYYNTGKNIFEQVFGQKVLNKCSAKKLCRKY